MDAAKASASNSSARLGAASSGAVRWWLLAAAVAALLFINLGHRGLNEPDEGRYTNIAIGMLEPAHDWWEPHMSGFAHFDKPPLVYWVTAVAFKVFGRTEWAARLPSVLGAMMALGGLGWAAWRLYEQDTAWWAVLFCATLGQFWVLARMLTPDMLLTGFITLAVGFWAEDRHRQGQGFWRWGCVLCATLAWWTKATAALVPLLGLMVGLVATRDHGGWRALRPFRLLVLVLIAGSPWYLGMIHRHPELKDFFFGRELMGRIAGHPDGRQGPIYFHVAFVLLGWMPWWPAALGMLAIRRREIIQRLYHHRGRALPIEAWMVLTGLTVYSIISSKLVTYSLPFAPWAALLCARWLIAPPTDPRRPRTVRRAFWAAAAITVLFVAASFALPHWESQLGFNSSMREVGRDLRERNASLAYADQYLPGMEFYFGKATFYVVRRVPRELASDAGMCKTLGESHFLSPAEFPAHVLTRATNAVWLVRYKGRTNSPLTTAWSQATAQEHLRVGDFVLDYIPARTNGVPKQSLEVHHEEISTPPSRQ